jgi:hypothetical protein
VVDGMREGGLIGFGGMGEAAEFANELDGRSANLVLRGRRGKVMERLDVAAHARFLAKTPGRSSLMRKEARDGTLA